MVLPARVHLRHDPPVQHPLQRVLLLRGRQAVRPGEPGPGGLARADARGEKTRHHLRRPGGRRAVARAGALRGLLPGDPARGDRHQRAGGHSPVGRLPDPRVRVGDRRDQPERAPGEAHARAADRELRRRPPRRFRLHVHAREHRRGARGGRDPPGGGLPPDLQHVLGPGGLPGRTAPHAGIAPGVPADDARPARAPPRTRALFALQRGRPHPPARAARRCSAARTRA